MADLQNDHAIDQPSAIGRDEKLASKKTGINDADYQSIENSLYDRRQPEAVRPYHSEHFDVAPQGQVNFGQNLTFRVGHQGGALIEKIEIIWEFGALTGAAGSNAEWKPWVGELLAGNDFQMRYSNNNLRNYSANFLHAYNRQMSDISNNDDDAYRLKVKAVPDLGVVGGVAANPMTVITPVWMPWDVRHRALIASGLPDEIDITFRVPTFASLIRRQPAGVSGVAAGDPMGTINTPEITSVRLRVHTVHVEKAERAYLTSLTHATGGIAWQLYHNEQHEALTQNLTFTTAPPTMATLATSTTRLDNIKNPCSYLFATCRYVSDLADATTAAPVIGTISSTDNCCPDPFAYLPASDWVVLENGRFFSQLWSYSYWEQSECAEYFNCELFQNIMVVPFCEHPMVDGHGMGHVTLSNLNTPQFRFRVQYRPNGALAAGDLGLHPDSDPWARTYGVAAVGLDPLDGNDLLSDPLNKRADIYGVVRQIAHQEKGELLLFYR